HQDRGDVEGQGRGRGRSLRGHEGDAGAVDHPRVARREDRHHRVSRGSGYVRGESAAAGESEPGNDCRCGRQASGSGGGRYPTLAGDREKRPERAAGGQAAEAESTGEAATEAAVSDAGVSETEVSEESLAEGSVEADALAAEPENTGE